MQIFKTIEKSECRVLIKHCFLMGKILFKQSNALISYLYSALLETMVKRWYADFKRGRTDTNDAEIQQLSRKIQPPHQKKLKLVLADRKLKLHEIAEEVKISEGSVFSLLHEHLSMKKLCSKWVLRLLTVKNTLTLFATVSMQEK